LILRRLEEIIEEGRGHVAEQNMSARLRR
jgi:hypothetical protein